jgi:dihydrofolate reductase
MSIKPDKSRMAAIINACYQNSFLISADTLCTFSNLRIAIGTINNLQMKVSVYVGISMDGFLARKNGDFGWLEVFADEDANKAYESFLMNIDAIVIGRKTLEAVLKFPDWPYKKDVFVLSHTLTELPEKARGNTSILSRKPADLLELLKEKGVENICVDGGQVIQDFLAAGLIDEMIISTVPVLIGSGISLFSKIDHDISFILMRSEIQANGLVRNHYLKKTEI